MLEPATYRFNPTTGFVNLIEDYLTQPNGIAISPDGSKISDATFPSIHFIIRINPVVSSQFPGSFESLNPFLIKQY
jgi:hypothetical protein